MPAASEPSMDKFRRGIVRRRAVRLHSTPGTGPPMSALHTCLDLPRESFSGVYA